jgi:hypothetical protein
MRRVLACVFILVTLILGQIKIPKPQQLKESDLQPEFLESYLSAKCEYLNKISIKPIKNKTVILLDFDGHEVKDMVGTPPFKVGDSGLDSIQIQEAVNVVKEDYSPFNVIITTDEEVYQKAKETERVRCVITDSYQYFERYYAGRAYAYVGTNVDFHCYVLSNALNYNTLDIGNTISHEVGHTLGLKHQSTWSKGLLIDVYNPGNPSWAPIMGTCEGNKFITWYKGSTVFGENEIEDEVEVLTKTVGVKTDDFGNTIEKAHKVKGSTYGILNTPGDTDWFMFKGKGKISLQSFGNTTPKVIIYDEDGKLIKVLNDDGEGFEVKKGKYFFEVKNRFFIGLTEYGKIGQFLVKIQ